MIKIYYFLKPIIPRSLQLALRRFLINLKIKRYRDIWPILESAGKSPENWVGWPESKRFAVVLTHDVESQIGHDRCEQLANIESGLGFRSSFNFVPQRYKVSKQVRERLVEMGFEIGVHGLNHDGKLYQTKERFEKRALKINEYLEEWGAVGFRSPAMHHNLKWLHALNIDYDLSTFDTDPFEPQPQGVGTIFPFWVPHHQEHGKGYLEMPYTIPQDFTPFVLLRYKNIEIWKKKVDWIVSKGGMVLANTHPDYMCFGGQPRLEEFKLELYSELLRYIKTKYHNQYWHVLPNEMTSFWKEQMNPIS